MRGQLLDATTGEPIAGVEVFTLPSMEWAEDEDFLRKGRHYARKGAAYEARVEGGEAYCYMFGICDTDAEGRFQLCRRAVWGKRISRFGCSDKPRTPPPYHGLRALLVEWPDGRHHVLDTTKGRYTVVGTRETYAIIDMGEVRIDVEERNP